MIEKIHAGLAAVEERELSRLRDIQFGKEVGTILGKFGKNVPKHIIGGLRNKETRAQTLAFLGYAAVAAFSMGLIPTGHAHASTDHGPSTPDTGEDLCKRPDVSCLHVTQSGGKEHLVVDFSGGVTNNRYFDPDEFCRKVDEQLIALGYDNSGFNCSSPRLGQYCSVETGRPSDYCVNSQDEWSGKKTPLRIGIETRQFPEKSLMDKLLKRDPPVTFSGQVGVLSGGNVVPLDVLTNAINQLSIYDIGQSQSPAPVYQVEQASIATATQEFLANPLPVDTLAPNTPVPTTESVANVPVVSYVEPSPTPEPEPGSNLPMIRLIIGGAALFSVSAVAAAIVGVNGINPNQNPETQPIAELSGKKTSKRSRRDSHIPTIDIARGESTYPHLPAPMTSHEAWKKENDARNREADQERLGPIVTHIIELENTLYEATDHEAREFVEDRLAFVERELAKADRQFQEELREGLVTTCTSNKLTRLQDGYKDLKATENIDIVARRVQNRGDISL